jgi:hypothetical protein
LLRLLHATKIAIATRRIEMGLRMTPNAPRSAPRRTRRTDCNRDGPQSFVADS